MNHKYIVLVDNLHVITLIEVKSLSIVNRFKNPLEDPITAIKILKTLPHVMFISDENGKIFEIDALFGKILKFFEVNNLILILIV